MPINEVKIRAYGGIRKEITIPFSNKSLLIHGDNGTGKSSIEKALRWALLGTNAPSSDPDSADESSFRRHILEPTDQPRVIISLADGGSIEVNHNKKKSNDKGTAFRNSCIVGNPFLRRSEILSFLQFRPGDRFAYLESFLDITTVDNISAKYNSKKDEIEASIESTRSKLKESIRLIMSRIPEENRTELNSWEDLEKAFVNYASSLSLVEKNKPCDWSKIQSVLPKAKRFSEGEQIEKTRARYVELQGIISDFDKKFVSKSLPDIGKLYNDNQKLMKATQDAPIADLLAHARKHLELGPVKACPICKKTIDRQAVLDDLVKRLNELDLYNRSADSVKLALIQWRSALAKFVSICPKVKETLEIKTFHELDKTLVIPSGFELFDDIENEVDNTKVLTQILAIESQNITRWFGLVVKATSAKLTSELSSIPVSSTIGHYRNFASLVDEADKVREALLLLQEKLKRLEFRGYIITMIAESIRISRQDVVKDIMESIANTVTTYYDAIHPPKDTKEATGPPRLKIQRHGRGTAFLQGQFNGQEVSDPNWVYSDGHLDTVGICIFLALRRFRGNQAGDSKILVLDDVVLSIDLAHARNLIKLIKDSFADHQVIIFTHNGLFAQWCSKLLPAIRRMQIHGWSLEDGPQIGEYLSAVQILEDSLADQQAKQIALNMMALMDEWLAECRYVYSLAVPAKLGEQYTLTEVWEPFVKALKKLGKDLNNDLGGAVSLVDELIDLPAIRNSLPAHENEFAREFPRKTIVEIAKNCILLVKSLYCCECCSFATPIPNRSNVSIVHCEERHIQYIKPSKTVK